MGGDLGKLYAAGNLCKGAINGDFHQISRRLVQKLGVLVFKEGNRGVERAGAGASGILYFLL